MFLSLPSPLSKNKFKKILKIKKKTHREKSMKTKVDSSKTNKKIDKLLARRTKKEKSEVTKLTNEK